MIFDITQLWVRIPQVSLSRHAQNLICVHFSFFSCRKYFLPRQLYRQRCHQWCARGPAKGLFASVQFLNQLVREFFIAFPRPA